MNIIAIMGPHGVFYKDEPIKELELALQSQGFQIIWPQNSVDLLKFIEHNPRICGVIFDWDEYSLDLCSDINQLNEYLPLYAFINTHSTMDVSVHDMRMALWFFEYALGQSEDIATRIRQYTNEYLDNITPPFTRALFTYVKEGKYTFCTPGHMAGTAYQKSPIGCLFYDFFGGNTLKADVSISVTELGSLLDHTGPHLEAEEYIARTFGAEQSYMVTNGTSTSNKIVGMYAAPSGSTLLIDRNCHKSLAHLLMMSDVVPLWLKPTRNALGILGAFLSVNLRVRVLNIRFRRRRRRSGRYMRLSPTRPMTACCTTPTGLNKRWMSLRSISTRPGCPIPIFTRFIRGKAG